MSSFRFIPVVLLFLASPLLAQPPVETSQGDLRPYSFSTAAYTGQTIRIVAQANSCDGSPVGFILDNVQLSAGGSVLNGSFESDLANWDVDDGGGSCSIYTTGAGTPIGFEGDNVAPQPSNGSLLAASSADSPGFCRVSQDVAIASAGTLSADMGWTFTRFSDENPGCEVLFSIEDLSGNVLDQAVVFRPAAISVPTLPLGALLLLSGLLGLLGWRRIGKAWQH